jgi:hypothetical protein
MPYGFWPDTLKIMFNLVVFNDVVLRKNIFKEHAKVWGCSIARFQDLIKESDCIRGIYFEGIEETAIG